MPTLCVKKPLLDAATARREIARYGKAHRSDRKEYYCHQCRAWHISYPMRAKDRAKATSISTYLSPAS